MHIIWKLIDKSRKADASLLLIVIKYAIYRMLGKSILCVPGTLIKGAENLKTEGLLQIGMSQVGFTNKHDRTYLNIRGTLRFKNHYSIARGCRFDIGEGARAVFGKGYVNANKRLPVNYSVNI